MANKQNHYGWKMLMEESMYFVPFTKFITDKTLPGELQSEAAADLVSDGVSASYPYASLSMQTLADAAGVPYGKVKLVYIPG